MWTLLVGVALAGYGDALEGRPSHMERELHVWTNAARIDPTAFADDLACWREFSSDQRKSRPPLALDHGLAEAARFHSDDMSAADPGGTGRALSHDSTDGTDFGARLARFYQGGRAIGENVAFNYGDAYGTLLAWLCSSGHRANVLESMFDEFGAGVASPYWTQDFGATGRGPEPMNMGVHLPEVPRGPVELLVDTHGERAAADVTAWLDGRAVPLQRVVGRGATALWSAETDAPADGCHLYWFTATVDGQEVRFPEEGAYGWGPCRWSDREARWVGAQRLAALFAEVEGEVERGCATTGGASGWLALGVAMLGVRRRR